MHSPPDYIQARAMTVELALAFGGCPPTDRKIQWEAFKRFTQELSEKGWTRGDIYRLVADVQNNEHEKLPEESLDALYDYETGLIGHCSHDCIIRFPGEPTDEAEFLEYVYGKRWLESH
jgi:hypothetical protein